MISISTLLSLLPILYFSLPIYKCIIAQVKHQSKGFHKYKNPHSEKLNLMLNINDCIIFNYIFFSPSISLIILVLFLLQCDSEGDDDKVS